MYIIKQIDRQTGRQRDRQIALLVQLIRIELVLIHLTILAKIMHAALRRFYIALLNYIDFLTKKFIRRKKPFLVALRVIILLKQRYWIQVITSYSPREDFQREGNLIARFLVPRKPPNPQDLAPSLFFRNGIANLITEFCHWRQRPF